MSRTSSFRRGQRAARQVLNSGAFPGQLSRVILAGPALSAFTAAFLFVSADVRAAGPVYVSVNAGGAALEIRPSAMHLVSNENLSRVRWSSWGGRYATGRATDYANGPSPGHKRKNPVRVRLERRRRCAGVLVYTVVRLHFVRGVPYAGQRHITRYRYGCPPD